MLWFSGSPPKHQADWWIFYPLVPVSMVPLGKSLMICNWSFGEFSNFRNFAIETGNRSRGKFHSLLHRWYYASTVHTVIIFRYLKKASVLGGMKVQGAQTTQFIFVFQNTIAVSRKKIVEGNDEKRCCAAAITFIIQYNHSFFEKKNIQKWKLH